MILPNTQWCWSADQSSKRLLLQTADEVLFTSHLTINKLVPDATRSPEFTLEHTQTYCEFCELLEQVSEGSEQFTHALNATVSKHFAKPLMPKNWLFIGAENGYSNQPLVYLSGGHIAGCFLVVESSEENLLCMLLDEQLECQGKTLSQYDLVKVHSSFVLKPTSGSYNL